ncbi:helix-turn-helix domain-containing protein [Streptomyces sp. NPDC093225]|uniref:helix-turn-helix domain-containing protein n=1 Tax=Streptomyces sp. NPDC093225 TaxID=3366034 RepID=UPI003823F901
MNYLAQPAFGQLVARLRREKGLSQADIAGDGVSSSYVSRLESGHRAPTAQAVRHLSVRLDVPEDTFLARSPQLVPVLLAEGVAALEDGRTAAAVTALTAAAEEAGDVAPESLWQVLWHLARAHERRGEQAERQRALDGLLAVAETLDSPALQLKALVQLAGRAHEAGDSDGALGLAGRAHALHGRHPQLPAADGARALLVLAAAEAEAGRLSDAQRHVELALAVPAEELGPLRAEVLAAAAAVAVRQGAAERGLALLEEALSGTDRKDGPLLWGRLRLAAVPLALRVHGTAAPHAEEWCREAATVVELLGEPLDDVRLTAVRAQLAFHRGEPAEAARLAARVLADPGPLPGQERTRTEILLHQAEIGLGRADEAVTALRAVAERLQAASSIDLAAEAWKALAEALVRAQH